MATISSIAQECAELLRRPDQATLILMRTRRAVGYLHGLMYFKKDYKELQFPIDENVQGYEVTVDYPPFCKKVNVVQPTDPDLHIPVGDVLTETTLATKLKEREFPDMINTWYEANGKLYISAQVEIKRIALGYHTYPNLTNDNVQTWLTEHYHQLVIDKVMFDMLTHLGDTQRAQSFARTAEEYKDLLEAEAM